MFAIQIAPSTADLTELTQLFLCLSKKTNAATEAIGREPMSCCSGL